MPTDLTGYIVENLAQGVPRSRITTILTAIGWQWEDIERAFEECGIPLPSPPQPPILPAAAPAPNSPATTAAPVSANPPPDAGEPPPAQPPSSGPAPWNNPPPDGPPPYLYGPPGNPAPAKTRTDLRKHLEALNGIAFSDAEWKQFHDTNRGFDFQSLTAANVLAVVGVLLIIGATIIVIVSQWNNVGPLGHVLCLAIPMIALWLIAFGLRDKPQQSVIHSSTLATGTVMLPFTAAMTLYQFGLIHEISSRLVFWSLLISLPVFLGIEFRGRCHQYCVLTIATLYCLAVSFGMSQSSLFVAVWAGMLVSTGISFLGFRLHQSGMPETAKPYLTSGLAGMGPVLLCSLGLIFQKLSILHLSSLLLLNLIPVAVCIYVRRLAKRAVLAPDGLLFDIAGGIETIAPITLLVSLVASQHSLFVAIWAGMLIATGLSLMGLKLDQNGMKEQAKPFLTTALAAMALGLFVSLGLIDAKLTTLQIYSLLLLNLIPAGLCLYLRRLAKLALFVPHRGWFDMALGVENIVPITLLLPFVVLGFHTIGYSVVAFATSLALVGAAIFLPTRTQLPAGAIGLFVTTMTISNRLFLNTLGWPIAVFMAGFMMLGLGYMVQRLNTRRKAEAPYSQWLEYPDHDQNDRAGGGGNGVLFVIAVLVVAFWLIPVIMSLLGAYYP